MKRNPQLVRYLKVVQEGWYATSRFCESLKRELQHYQPQLVFAVLGNYGLTKSITRACQQLGIPMYLFVTDDFVSSLYRTAPNSWIYKSAAERWFRKAIQYSIGAAAISPLMAEELEGRYGRPWDWYTTLVDPACYRPTSSSLADGVFRLAYTGEIHLERWKVLRAIALALKDISERTGQRAEFKLYVPGKHVEEYRGRLEIEGVTKLFSWVPFDELPSVFHQSDALVHVESFDPKLAEYTKLSFSTKLSQYMMANRCIFFVGPKETGSSRMLERIGAGIMVNESDQTAIRNGLQSLLCDHQIRLSSAQKGRNWALEWVDIHSGSERFYRAVQNSLGKSTGSFSEKKEKDVFQ